MVNLLITNFEIAEPEQEAQSLILAPLRQAEKAADQAASRRVGRKTEKDETNLEASKPSETTSPDEASSSEQDQSSTSEDQTKPVSTDEPPASQ